MKSFLFAAAIAASVLTCSAVSTADEPLVLDYTFSGNTGVNLSSIAGGPLSVNDFTDARPGSGASEIQRPGKDSLTLADQTAAALLQTTFSEAFTASGAQLGSADSPLKLEGKIVEMQITETAQGLETLIRVELTLRNQGRNAWQSVVFSRAQSEGADLSAALEQGLNRIVTELFRDDYFLMELGIF